MKKVSTIQSLREESKWKLTVNEWNAWTIRAAFTHTLKIAFQEVRSTYLQALLNDLGCELVHAILSGITKNVVDSAATVSGEPMLTDMLDAPVAKLSMGDNVDAMKHFVNARSLVFLETVFEDVLELPSCQSLQEQLRATCHAELR